MFEPLGSASVMPRQIWPSGSSLKVVSKGVGDTVGASAGLKVGEAVTGEKVGEAVTGALVGEDVVGAAVGAEVGAAVGAAVVGAVVGAEVVGEVVGEAVVGLPVGEAVVGAAVGGGVQMSLSRNEMPSAGMVSQQPSSMVRKHVSPKARV